MPTIRKRLFYASLILAAVVLSAGWAHADAVTYTFSGTGAGTVNGTAWSGAFSVVLTGDTTGITSSPGPFFRLNGLGGTFTEGAVNATLAPTITIVSSAGMGLDLINFFNATFNNGLGLFDPALAGYDLATSIGPLGPASGANLTPTFGGGTFASSDGPVEFTSDSTLTFTASTATTTPEPSTLLMLALALGGLALLGIKRRPVMPQSIA
jgi:hypothetical protein